MDLATRAMFVTKSPHQLCGEALHVLQFFRVQQVSPHMKLLNFDQGCQRWGKGPPKHQGPLATTESWSASGWLWLELREVTKFVSPWTGFPRSFETSSLPSILVPQWGLFLPLPFRAWQPPLLRRRAVSFKPCNGGSRHDGQGFVLAKQPRPSQLYYFLNPIKNQS